MLEGENNIISKYECHKRKKKKIEEMFQIKGAKETRKNAIPNPRLDPELEGDILGSTD